MEWYKKFCERHDLDPFELAVGLAVFGSLMTAWFGLMTVLYAIGAR